VALWLFLASILAYNLNLREISASDTIATRLLAVTLAREFRLDLDPFFRDYPLERRLPPWMQYVGGHFVSTSPVFPSLLAAPIYFLPVWLLWVDPPLINLLAKLSASLFAALSVVVVYLALREVAAPRAALAAAVVYAFGTSTWSISSQGLGGHGPAELFMGVAMLGLLLGSRHRWAFDCAGLAAGLMFASRPQTTGLMGAALVGAALWRDRWRGVRCLLWSLGPVCAVLVYNVWTFGSILGGYARLNAVYMPLYRLESAWSSSIGSGLLGLLVSPSRGLFVYSPVLLFALMGVVRARAHSQRDLLAWLGAGLGASILGLSAYSLWWGGHSFGPRLLTDFLPAWAVFLALAWGWIESSRRRVAAFVCLAAVSVAVQAIGAFDYPSPREVDWDKTPRDVDVAHERLWDWRDPQLLRLLRNGPRAPGFGGWPSLFPEAAERVPPAEGAGVGASDKRDLRRGSSRFSAKIDRKDAEIRSVACTARSPGVPRVVAHRGNDPVPTARPRIGVSCAGPDRVG
jgi:hypothetical protein